ncbi:MAG: PEP-CTERM sorting domain-containing protein [Verrucomicrobiaceae bacterium]
MKTIAFTTCKLTALTLSLTGMASATTVSVDFMGTSSTPPMVSSDTAGVVPAQFWEPAFGLSGGVSPLTGAGTVSGVAVQWNSTMSWDVPGYVGGSIPGPGDDQMMSRGIATFLTSMSPPSAIPVTVDVTIASLASLGWSSYDVYIYSSHNNGPGGLSEISYTSVGTGFLPESLTESSPAFGTVAGSNYINGTGASSGNYIKFSGMDDLNFRIASTPAVLLPNNDISIINGIQIVGTPVPEPSSVLLSLLGGTLALLRRQRA